MAVLNSRILFVTTSPRTPERIIPELDLLDKYFAGEKWDKKTQTSFMELLSQKEFFLGEGKKDPAFSARDRINRAPKAYGFVTLSPLVELTPAGKLLISSRNKQELFFRQLLKFQLPSPYHKLGRNCSEYCVKPFLELFRLIRHFGHISFDELQIFGLQLIDFRKFNRIVSKIEKYRCEKEATSLNYNQFKQHILHKEILAIYREDIVRGKIKTRENKKASLEKFISTKASNMRDYADACIRYLRATGMVELSYSGHTISIVPEHRADVDYVLTHCERKPIFLKDTEQFVNYIGNPRVPALLTDDESLLREKLQMSFPEEPILDKMTLDGLKTHFDELVNKRKAELIKLQVSSLKSYREYEDIQALFDKIAKDRTLYDAPLMLEWNTWRAMTMLDGGEVTANFKFDDFGRPLSTAMGNRPDIECDYGNFAVAVEVTMQKGHKQYEKEGESIARHTGKLAEEKGKNTYCLFIAPNINPTVVSHCFVLHKLNVAQYGGRANIIPLPLNVFKKMVDDSYNAAAIPTPQHIKRLFDRARELAKQNDNDKVWYDAVLQSALDWLNIG